MYGIRPPGGHQDGVWLRASLRKKGFQVLFCACRGQHSLSVSRVGPDVQFKMFRRVLTSRPSLRNGEAGGRLRRVRVSMSEDCWGWGVGG